MTKSKGKARITITHEDGSVTQTPWISNLLNNLAIATTGVFARRMFLMDSSAPTKIDLDPALLDQSGNLVTVSGAFSFTNLHVGDTIKYSNGDTALIIELLSATQVRTFESYTKANQIAEIYRTNALGLDDDPIGAVQQSVDRSEDNRLYFDLEKYTIYESIFSFGIFTGTPYTLRSMIIGNTSLTTSDRGDDERMARIVLPTPIDILENDVVKVEYQMKIDFFPKTPQMIDVSDFLSGYPYVYNIINASSFNNGSQEILTVEVDEDHHFEPGDKVTVSGVDVLIDGIEMDVSKNVNATTYRCISPSAITPVSSGTCQSRGEVEFRVDGFRVYEPSSYNFLSQYREVFVHDETNYLQDIDIPTDGSDPNLNTNQASIVGLTNTTSEPPTFANGLTFSKNATTGQFSNLRRAKQIIFPNNSSINRPSVDSAIFLTFTDPQPIHDSSTFDFSIGKRFRQDLS